MNSSFVAIDTIALETISGGSRFWDGTRRVLDTVANDGFTGWVSGAAGGAVVGGVGGAILGTAAGPPGTAAGAYGGALAGAEVGGVFGTAIGGLYGLGHGLGREAGLWE